MCKTNVELTVFFTLQYICVIHQFNRVNDRISFKKFLGLSFSDPSYDHSTFSRFRKRLSKEAMTQINTEILRQFAKVSELLKLSNWIICHQ